MARTSPPLDKFELLIPRERAGPVSLAGLAGVPTVIHLFTG